MIPIYGRKPFYKPLRVSKPTRAAEIRELLRQGLTPDEIADALGIKPTTVYGYIRRGGIT